MLWVKEMSKLVKCFLGKHEVLHLISRTYVKLAMVMSVCFPSTGEKETGGSLGLWSTIKPNQ